MWIRIVTAVLVSLSLLAMTGCAAFFWLPLFRWCRPEPVEEEREGSVVAHLGCIINKRNGQPN